MTLSFDLPGDWTSAWGFLRLLTAARGPWVPDEAGELVNDDTGERVHLEMYPPTERLAEVYAAGVCPVRPTVDDELFMQVERHRSTVRLSLDEGAHGPREALTLLRAASAVVHAGALAVRCGTSGLVHGGDAVGPLLARAEAAAADGDVALAAALYESFVLLTPARTFGLHAFGRPDLVLDPAEAPEPALAVVRLEDEALALLRGGAVDRAHPDALSKADPRHNPFGCAVV